MPERNMPAVVVVFHMNGCPHCPPALEACNKLQDTNVVSIESQHPLVEDLGISSFPTILLSLPSALFEYRKGPRSTDAIQKWLASKL